ncbi:leucine-rich repeat extensin-like protein 5 [Sinocyclocheilus rhinocerous]|uniref:leucine-rich repeat extensin-like protein 5 n=1 Tax=Sinocyclocheilus rhinocerous TaxID=307959 RepID=UPI0007BA88A7|nr:PREDICTED: leucine-rich repeat extensin-like protein 5 [Sinocyclocheilus rhinocerous]
MDSPALHLLLRPESRRWLEYLGWMLQNGGLSLKVSEPETPTGLIQEPEPESTKAEETKHADQSTVKPGADMNLIDLWSVDPVPTQVPTLKPLSSSPVPSGLLEAPVPSGDLPPPMSLSDFLVPSPPLVSASPQDSSAPLVSSSSSALPPPLAQCGSSASPQASPPPARYGAESPASLRPSRPMSPPRPVSPPTPLRLCIPSAPPRLVCPRTPL